MTIGAVVGTAAWAVVVLALAWPAFAGWGHAWRAWGGAAWDGTVGAGIWLAPFRHLALVVLAALCAASCAGAGGPAGRVLSFRPLARRDRRAVSVLAGFALFGAWHLGLALTGVFDARVLVAGWILALGFHGARDLASIPLRSRLPVPPGSPWGWAAAFGATVVPLAGALVPDAHVDALTYHLAIPEQFLKAHKYTVEGAGLAHLFPLAAELNYAPAIAFGLHALPHFIQLVPFLAAVALLAGWAAARGGAVSGWLVVLVALTWGGTGRSLVVAKNDLAAAAFMIGGAVALARAVGGERGWWWVAAALAGCGATVKTNGILGAAVVGAAVLVTTRAFGPVARWGLVAVVPFVPWALRGWLMTGDPVWPVLSGIMPGALWDDASAQSLRIARGITDAATRWAGLVAGLHELAGEHPAVAIVLPGGAWAAWYGRGAGRRAPARVLIGWAAACAAGFWVVMPGEWVRLSLGPALVVAAVALTGMPDWPRVVAPRARPWLVAAGVLLTWAPLGRTVAETWRPATTLRALTGALSPDGVLALERSTLQDTGEGMRGLPGGVRRVIGFGDIRGYRLPGRFLAERCFGRTWAWALAGESADVDRLRIRFRQLGVSHVLYNFVTESFPHHHAAPFPWDARRLRVWRGFVGRHLELVVRPAHVDHANGGFAVYGLRARPLARDPEWLPYLPGIESLYYEVTRHGLRGDADGWLRAAERLDARVPGVDFIADLKGAGYRLTERWREAYAAYAIGVGHGTVNDANYWSMAASAFRLGRFSEAFELFNRAIEISPYLRPEAEPAFAVIRQVLARPAP